MKKKKSGGGGANWMDTYGDMVTLLLCFFVLLYSISTISEDKWKALVQSFNPDARPTQSEIPPGNLGPSADNNNIGPPPVEITEEQMEEIEEQQEDVDQMMDELYEMLKEYAEQEGAGNTISVTKGDGKVFITFNQTVFFDGESPALREDSYPILDKLSGIFNKAEPAIDEVRVLGHTAQGSPGKPNNPYTDRNLSAQRSANVVAYIQIHSNIKPARLVSEGIGQWQPIETNDTADGRAANRRVEIIVSGRNIEQEVRDGILTFETE